VKRMLSVVSAMLVLVMPTARAQNVISGPSEIPWNYATCFQPFFSEFNWDSPGRLLVLSGGATQCGPTVPGGGFRIATYRPDTASGSAPGWNVRLFPDDSEGTMRLFGAVVVPNTPGQYGVCVLGSDQERVMCGLATVAPRTRTQPPSALIVPLAPDDPLVAKSVVTSPYIGQLGPPNQNGDPGANCGTCF
jgi:hypothetical protein